MGYLTVTLYSVLYCIRRYSHDTRSYDHRPGCGKGDRTDVIQQAITCIFSLPASLSSSATMTGTQKGREIVKSHIWVPTREGGGDGQNLSNTDKAYNILRILTLR